MVAAVFIAFALSRVVPRAALKPDFPGPTGLSVFVIASIAHVRAMVVGGQFLRLAVPCPHFGEVAEWLKAAPC